MSNVAKLFLKLTGTTSGPIAGECKIAKYVGQIEIDDWSWNIKKEKRQGGDGESVPVPSAVSFTKLLDKATTPMLAAVRSGDRLTAIVTLEEVAADQFSLIMTFTGGRLLDYSLDAKDQDKGGIVEETWTLDYRKVTFEHLWAGKRGTSKYTLMRPDWASKDSPGGAKANKVSEIAKLAADVPAGELDKLWKQVEELINKRKNETERQDKAESGSG